MKTVLTMLISVHIYLLTRYCVANIFPQQRLDQLTKLKRLMIVALIPFYGYYYVCNLERESV